MARFYLLRNEEIIYFYRILTIPFKMFYMEKKILFISIMAIIVALMGCEPQQKFDYPETTKVDQVDVYFGDTVPDPYRWLENDTSKQTGEWVKAQNEVTFGYLEEIPFRKDIEERLTEIWDYPRVSAPFEEGGRYYIFKNDGLQNQDVAYVKESLDAEEEVILDPNKFSDDGTVSLTAFTPSPGGKYLGYGISRGGSDWDEFYVMDPETKEVFDDKIMWVKFSPMAWYGDGFYYSRYPEPEEGQQLSGVNLHNKVYYHKIGDPQSEDKLIYEDPENPGWSFAPAVTDDKELLGLYVYESTDGNDIYYKHLNKKNSKFKRLVNNFDDNYDVIEHIDGKLLIRTDNGASKYRLVSVDLGDPGMENWVDILPEKEDVLSAVSVVGGKIIARYMRDAHSVVEVYDLEGNFLYEIDIPVLGTVYGFSGDIDDKLTFYTVTSFTTPSIVYKYDVENNISEEYSRSQVDFDPNLYEVKQEFYNSKDGTKVPMFIIHKKGLEKDGKNPVLLYGYGGFNISITPSFSVTRLPLLENGFVLAVANLRGGGEYGEEWHQAGTKMNKQNVFDDFIAAAEYLIEEDYTSKGKIAIQGGSNGGLLVGAVTNQRPDLFGVSLAAVGVMDMLRYHKFTIGKFWATDYGTSEDSKEMFEYLSGYSPIHNISSDKDYPAVLVTTADHDDRVVPAHSFKYIATLQEHYKGPNPVMIRIETKAGHGAGKPTSKIIEEYADVWAFTMYNLGVEPEY